MHKFAHLLDALVLNPGRNRKLELLADYFRSTPDPDRGYALAALTGSLDFPHVKSQAFRKLVLGRIDPVLFALSYDYVGDLADTVALIWPAVVHPLPLREGAGGGGGALLPDSGTPPPHPLGELPASQAASPCPARGEGVFPIGHNTPPSSLPTITELVETLRHTPKAQVDTLLARWLDAGDETERWGLIKLVTGNLRIGLSARLAKQALALISNEVTVERIEEAWHGLAEPFTDLFAWLEGRGGEPERRSLLTFRPLMLSYPSDDLDKHLFQPDIFAAEWKWDGIRVQLVGNGEDWRLYSRSGEDITGAFPDIVSSSPLAGEDRGGGAQFVPGPQLPPTPSLPRKGGGGTDGGGDTNPSASPTDKELGITSSSRLGAPRPVTPPFIPHATLDGELLVHHGGEEVASFNQLQQRLNRKSPTAKQMEQWPAHLRLYDLLFEGEEDLRPLPFRARRARLEGWYARHRPTRMDLSALVEYPAPDYLADLQARAREGSLGAEIEGFMLKRWDAPYIAGRPKGYWYKWKRDPLSADVVLMYAQRGHGKRSSFYSDYTFGAWTEGAEGTEMLVPVGKAYSGYTDEELVRLDRWIRNHTTERFGPVRGVAPTIVFEVGFDGIQPSGRHKSGLAMRFPRILRIRWDKPAVEADRLETLRRMIVG